jgi:hypothetical protein
MKKNLCLLLILAAQINFAQNTFPVPTGKVGIGTLSPSVELDVIGTIKSYNPVPLGAAINSFQVINDIRGNVGDNTISKKIWLYRDGTLNNWFNSRIHDGISVDGSFGTPNVDTKTWWERDPKDNIQSWGTDNATYLTINAGNVGIGTTLPSAKLDVRGGIISNISGTLGGYIKLKNPSKNTNGAASDWTIFNMTGNYGNSLQFFAYDDFGCVPGGLCSNRFTIMDNGNVGIGMINPINKLDVNGTIHSQEVKVDMIGWSDFVFKKEYTLPTLEEVEKHIAEKGHLENIPNEEEVLKNGINLGEMNAKLLQKIEELTLYVIEQNKRLDKVEKENNDLRNLIESHHEK